ncbi:murein biosynthesis integral membrane protein MurJ [Myxococcota bacterium]|nr:murein biosynthesis integral membrane protein MurJ [Myxococcota bacterium]
MAEEKPVSISRAAGIVGFFTLLSRVAGLLRDSMMAYVFPKVITDIFTVAFTIPNVLRYLLAEGALSISFIPVYTEYRRKNPDETERFVQTAFTVTAIIVAGVTVAGILAAPVLVTMFAGGFSDEPAKFQMTVNLTRILFPYIFFVSLMALSMGVLNTLGHFVTPALAPMFWNLICVAAGFSAPFLGNALGVEPIYVFAWGVVFGGIIQFAIQIPPMRARKVTFKPRPQFGHPGVVKMAKLMLPALFGLAVYQFNVLLSRLFASFLETGALSSLYYSQRLIEFPMGVFAVAIATASMPTLSAHASDGDLEKLKSTLRTSLELTFFVVLPSAVGLFVMAEPLVAILFQRGQFGVDMARITAMTLMAFTLGVPSAGIVRNLVPAYYATSDSRTPVIASACSLLSYMMLGPLFAWHFGVVGLAVAISLSSWINATVLIWRFRKKVGDLELTRLLPNVLRMAAAAVLMGAAVWGACLPGVWSRGGNNLRNLAVFLVALGAGMLVYAGAATALGLPHTRRVFNAVLRRGRKNT